MFDRINAWYDRIYCNNMIGERAYYDGLIHPKKV